MKPKNMTNEQLAHNLEATIPFLMKEARNLTDAEEILRVAAAPKMYAKAWELITAFDNRVMSPKHIEALRKALAEAAGEEVGNGR